ncbi:PIR protein, putative [Plasmodium sp.]|nr:PIR protein, putative [Plasmodium sp.]
MKVHYINILLFALPLNILVTLCHVSSKKYPYITHNTPSTKSIRTPRTLCEYEWYAPSNYDKDPEMKEVMKNYNRQASGRFKAYDERMNKNRQKCKEQCDKEIQKIILKDKIHKELTQHLSTLETNIDSNDIPTCVCEKSLEDKIEKTCFKCTQNLGGIVAPSSIVLGGIAELGLIEWKTAALLAAEKEAMIEGAAEGAAAGIKEGIEVVMDGLNGDFGLTTLGGKSLESFFSTTPYTNASKIAQAVYTKFEQSSCLTRSTGTPKPICSWVFDKTSYGTQGSANTAIESHVKTMVSQAKITAEAHTEAATETAIATLKDLKTGAVNVTYGSFQTAIIASIVTIVVIVLVMVIIYLILRYRRKKKMKKKLQYIKLLKE